MTQRTSVEEPLTVLPPTCSLLYYITSDIEEHMPEKKKMMAWG